MQKRESGFHFQEGSSPAARLNFVFVGCVPLFTPTDQWREILTAPFPASSFSLTLYSQPRMPSLPQRYQCWTTVKGAHKLHDWATNCLKDNCSTATGFLVCSTRFLAQGLFDEVIQNVVMMQQQFAYGMKKKKNKWFCVSWCVRDGYRGKNKVFTHC